MGIMNRSTVLVDTSALYALLTASDPNNTAAGAIWNRLLDGDHMVTHSGIVIESSALVQRRLGLEAARVLHDDLLPLIDITWIDQHLHDHAVTAMLAARRRDVSLVDHTSFELMRQRAITTAFAFDDDFLDQGFDLLTA